MARADLLLALVRASLVGDERRIRGVVEALAAEERAKKHTVLADQLGEELSRLGSRPHWESLPAPVSPQPSNPGLLEVQPKLRLADLALPDAVRRDLLDLIEEQHRADLLRTFNVEPRHRVLLTGPPGNGKTSTVEALAAELALPLFVLRYEEVITSYLGETSSRLEAALNEVRRRHCVLFLDEFDSLAKERGDEHDTGEIKRVVSTLLLQVDRLPSYVVVCGATNHPELLDRAVWRRFQVRVDLPGPTRAERAAFIAAQSERLSLELGRAPRTIADKLGSVSYAETRDFILDVQRRHILAMGTASGTEITDSVLARWTQRRRITRSGLPSE